MKFPKPDGVIEYGISGCCCPPGEIRKGMHTNSTTSWWRIDSGAWNRIRHQSTFMTFAQASETCAEFKETIEKYPYGEVTP
jgi:hypothetical protein